MVAQSSITATARNGRHISRSALNQMVAAEKHTIYDEEIFGWNGYRHDLKFVDTDSYHECTTSGFRTMFVGWGSVTFKTESGKFEPRETILRNERNRDQDYDIGWSDRYEFW